MVFFVSQLLKLLLKLTFPVSLCTLITNSTLGVSSSSCSFEVLFFIPKLQCFCRSDFCVSFSLYQFYKCSCFGSFCVNRSISVHIRFFPKMFPRMFLFVLRYSLCHVQSLILSSMVNFLSVRFHILINVSENRFSQEPCAISQQKHFSYEGFRCFSFQRDCF